MITTLLSYLQPGQHIFELGCGTGIDACYLAEKGFEVTGCDVSPEMVLIALAKVKEKGEQDRVHIFVSSASEAVKQLVLKPLTQRIPLIYANFGVLNCEPDLPVLVLDLNAALAADGKLVFLIMNKYCLWEIIYCLLQLNPKQAFRRFIKKKEFVSVSLTPNSAVNILYYTPREFAQIFASRFQVIWVAAVFLFTPPPYLDHWAQRFPKIISILAKLDKLLSYRFPFNQFGDHFLIVLSKKK